MSTDDEVTHATCESEIMLDQVTRLTYEEALSKLENLAAQEKLTRPSAFKLPDLSEGKTVFCSSSRLIVRQVNMLTNQGMRKLKEENRLFLSCLLEHLIQNLKRLISKESNVFKYIRSFYYDMKNQSLKGPDAADIAAKKIIDFIDSICCLFKCDRESLGVTACDTISSYVGNIILERQDINDLEQEVVKEDGSALTQPYRINFSNIKSVQPGEVPPQCILVVEKMTLFNSLFSSGIRDKIPCVIICGSGQPSIECRLFVKMVHEALKDIPIFAIVDCNPFGFDIFKTYKYGSMNLAFMSRNLAVNSIRLLGIFHSDFAAYGVKVSDLEKLKKSDSSRLQNMLKEEWLLQEPDILASLETTKKINRKADVEKLATELGYTDFVNKVIIEKIMSKLESQD